MAMKFDPKKDVTRSLKFKPLADLGNLCLGTLQKVEVTMNEVPKFKDDGSESMFEYAGHTLPSLKFVFKNHLRKEDKDRAERFFTYVESVIISKKNDGTPMDTKVLTNLYEQMWDRLKHIHDAYSNEENYKPFGELPEIDETADVDVRVTQFTKFFKTVADAFNKGKGGKAIFTDKEGNGLPVAIKLLANYPSGKWLTIPNFVGEGFIERFIPGRPLTIEVKPGESVALKGGKVSDSGGSGVSSSDVPKEIMDMLNKDA